MLQKRDVLCYCANSAQGGNFENCFAWEFIWDGYAWTATWAVSQVIIPIMRKKWYHRRFCSVLNPIYPGGGPYGPPPAWKSAVFGRKNENFQKLIFCIKCSRLLSCIGFHCPNHSRYSFHLISSNQREIWKWEFTLRINKWSWSLRHSVSVVATS